MFVFVVLSGNCNFEGCIYVFVKVNFLVLLLLVVVYVFVGIINVDMLIELIGCGNNGEEVFLDDIWLSLEEVKVLVEEMVILEFFCE